ncbi:tudor domain-containing protein 7A [Esox lucius]|uniref:Tudor domain-containing protein 7 n=1 Tax=Esox lucius TaxID=8010 RepID=A0AAY5K117_ESOLU|nr:tudor domain-containing protein 7A [Esox lucius]XP_010889975.3 tudor domain-containing protein 7A [Esox lucius]
MSDDQMKKMLRAVLQSNKNGVSISRLQGDYRSLTGEYIPYKQLGYPSLETLLHSIPSVVRMENRMGEVMCHAAVCQETAHIAQLVARQKSNKKVPGRSRMLNCQMRPKQSSSFMLYSKLRTSLRQPDLPPARPVWGQPYGSEAPARSRGNKTYGGFSASGDVRKMYNQHVDRVNSHAPPPQGPNWEPVPQANVQREGLNKKMIISSKPLHDVNNLMSNKPKTVPAAPKPSALQTSVYNPKVVQSLLTEVLKKFTSGLWLSKLPEVYRAMHNQDLPGQAVIDLVNWTHICCVEKPGSTNRADRLVYPPQPKSPSPVVVPFQPKPTAASVKRGQTVPAHPVSRHSVTPVKPVNLAPLFLTMRSPSLNQSQTSPATAPSWQHSPTSPAAPSDSWTRAPNSASPPSTSQNSFSASSLLTPTSPTPPPIASPRQPSSPAVDVPADVRVKLRELLSKYNQGLWAHALPKLYQETFKVPFPEDILANLCLLFDVCTVEYPMPDKKKAILYGPAAEHKAEASSTPASPLGCKFSSSSDVPPLVLPKVEFPSVLVVEASSTTQVVLRYIGEDYSQAQQAMEESMRTLYSQPGAQRPLSFPRPGTLAAVKVEGGEEVVRAQVSEVMKDTVKVYYVDHGFSEVISKTQLMELQKDFFKLPFQASLCTLAGLGPFSSERSVLSTLESLAVGRILLAELLEQDVATPRVLLYDTSLSEDVNINAACLKALQDTTMENPLQVNSTYMNVSVTNVCSDGTIYCQLPSRGRVKLNEILEKVEAFFITQVTSDSLVSLPFCGMCCLARHKGKWSRVEITNLHGSRVLDIRFVDLGVPASVEVTELREIPPPFLRELAVIPPQAIKCCLVDLPPEMWTPEAVLWLRDAVLHSEDCMMTISKLDEAKLVHIYLFSSNGSQNDTNSINRQMATSGLWKRPAPAPQKDPSPRFLETTLSSVVDQVTLHSSDRSMGSGDMSSALSQALHTSVRLGMQLALPSPMELPQAGQNMDVFVSVACHPGHFVLQPWQDLYKLVVLMGEMILYYNQREERLVSLELRKGEVYAAKVDNNWHRVLVKAILSNGLVSVYELDYGKHELVGSRELEPLIESFRQLPFQAVRAQLAGVQQRVWSEAASIVFRNHVEKKPLVAQVESVVEAEFPWDRKVVVYLVDTSQKEKDVWIHNIIADFPEELSTAV